MVVGLGWVAGVEMVGDQETEAVRVREAAQGSCFLAASLTLR
jgi:hypothetical protein